MQKLGMKPVPGVSRVTIKKSKNVSAAAARADCVCLRRRLQGAAGSAEGRTFPTQRGCTGGRRAAARARALARSGRLETLCCATLGSAATAHAAARRPQGTHQNGRLSQHRRRRPRPACVVPARACRLQRPVAPRAPPFLPSDPLRDPGARCVQVAGQRHLRHLWRGQDRGPLGAGGRLAGGWGTGRLAAHGWVSAVRWAATAASQCGAGLPARRRQRRQRKQRHAMTQG